MIRIEGIPTVTARLQRSVILRPLPNPPQAAPRNMKAVDPPAEHAPRAAA